MSGRETEDKVDSTIVASTAGGDTAGLDTEAIEKLQKLIQRVEGNLIRRIASLETIISRVDGLEDNMGIMKADIQRALQPRDPKITREDVDRWNATCKKTEDLEEALRNLKLFVEDYPKIKADVLNILKIQNTFVTKDSLAPLIEKIRVMEESLKDVRHDIGTVRDVQLKTEKIVEANHNELLDIINGLKAKLNSLEEMINALKKQISMLDDKVKAMGKAAAVGGNAGMAGNLLDDLEKQLAELRKDHNDLKQQNAREHDQFREQLAGKASREDLADLEARMMQRLQDLIDQLKNMIPDKEALKKKLAALEKSVSETDSATLISANLMGGICNLRRILFANLDQVAVRYDSGASGQAP